MDLLIDSSRTDRISEFLRVLRVRGTIYCRSHMSSPWGFRVKGSGSASFHLLLAGGAWLEVDGSDPMRLLAGDVVVLPHGDDHQLRDDLASDIEFLDEILQRTPPIDGRLRYGGGGEVSEIVCGGFVVEDPEIRPLLNDLPRVLHSQRGRADGSSVTRATSGLVSALTDEHIPGRSALADRLAEVILTHAISDQATGSSADRSMSVVGESAIAAALEMIRSDPARAWTVGELARRVGMSRSSFSERFRNVTGDPPMSYVRKSRLGRAARYLVGTDWGLAYIARRTGYDSHVALSKAFKKQFGKAPRDYRSAARAALDSDHGAAG
jgi:AraC-like DNA-binding protein